MNFRSASSSTYLSSLKLWWLPPGVQAHCYDPPLNVQTAPTKPPWMLPPYIARHPTTPSTLRLPSTIRRRHRWRCRRQRPLPPSTVLPSSLLLPSMVVTTWTPCHSCFRITPNPRWVLVSGGGICTPIYSTLHLCLSSFPKCPYSWYSQLVDSLSTPLHWRLHLRFLIP